MQHSTTLHSDALESALGDGRVLFISEIDGKAVGSVDDLSLVTTLGNLVLVTFTVKPRGLTSQQYITIRNERSSMQYRIDSTQNKNPSVTIRMGVICLW